MPARAPPLAAYGTLTPMEPVWRPGYGLHCPRFKFRPEQPIFFFSRMMFILLHVVPRLFTLNIPSLARQRCYQAGVLGGPPWFFCNFSAVWCGRLIKLCFLGFWNYNSVIQALLASNILCLFISTEVTGGTELLHTHSSLVQNLNNVIFWALSAGHFLNLQRSEPKSNKNNNIPHL